MWLFCLQTHDIFVLNYSLTIYTPILILINIHKLSLALYKYTTTARITYVMFCHFFLKLFITIKIRNYKSPSFFGFIKTNNRIFLYCFIQYYHA